MYLGNQLWKINNQTYLTIWSLFICLFWKSTKKSFLWQIIAEKFISLRMWPVSYVSWNHVQELIDLGSREGLTQCMICTNSAFPKFFGSIILTSFRIGFLSLKRVEIDDLKLFKLLKNSILSKIHQKYLRYSQSWISCSFLG